jgi:hypothetical protein
VVLAVKTCFFDSEMRKILIEKTTEKIVYHDRFCSRQGIDLLHISAATLLCLIYQFVIPYRKCVKKSIIWLSVFNKLHEI